MTKHLPKTPLLAVLALAALLPSSPAADPALDRFDLLPSNIARISTRANPDVYYVLEDSDDLSLFVPMAMELGQLAPAWHVARGDSPQAYFRIHSISVHAPADTDGDGIDDLYELAHPGSLDPLNPLDAALDLDGTGFSQLENYRLHFGFESSTPQIYSREISLFNLGAQRTALEALSPELSVWNSGAASSPVESISREITIYNGQAAPSSAIPQVHSRELTVLNHHQPTAPHEAISRSVSVYNGHAAPTSTIPEAFSHELTIWNIGTPATTTDAISRETTLFNLTNGATLP